MIKKAIFPFILLLLLNFSNTYAWCIMGKGKDCKDTVKANNIINVGGYGIGKTEAEDGAVSRKRGKGNKAKNQGYAEYREHFFFYSYEFYAAPHQNAVRSMNAKNRSLAYEYAFNPFISFKVIATELYFNSFEDKETLKHEHIGGLINLRIYLLNNFVVRSGVGVATSKIDRSNDNYNERDNVFSGQTNIVQMSLMYIWGDENTMIGITNTTVEGRDGDNINLGVSYYGITLGIGF